MIYLIVALQVVQLTLVALTSAQRRVVYVLPDGQSLSQCPVRDCYSLLEVVVFRQKFFASNTTVALLQGTHFYSSWFNEVVVIESVRNFALTAASESAGATIKCNGSVGFHFRYTHNLTISGVTFEECGAHQLQFPKYSVSATLYILISCDVYIKNMTVTRGKGIGLLVLNVYGRFYVLNSSLSHNQLNFCLFTKSLKVNHDRFLCNTVSSSEVVIAHSNFTYGSANPKEEINYYYGFSSGITLHTYSVPRYLLTGMSVYVNIRMISVYLENNQAKMGNLFIEYNACTTKVYINGLISNNCSIGAYLKPRLLRATYCSLQTEWGVAQLISSSFIKTSIFLSVPPDDLPGIDDLEVSYVYKVTIYNVSIVGNDADKTLHIFNLHQVSLRDVILEDNKGKSLIVLLNTEVVLEGLCIFRRNIGGVAVLQYNRLIFNESSEIQFVDMTDNSNAPLHLSYADIIIQQNSSITFRNNTGLLSGAIALVGSIVTFTGDRPINVSFVHNKGVSGGAIALYDKSKLEFHARSRSYLTFIENYASKVGGAIFIKDVEYLVTGVFRGNEPFFELREDVMTSFYFLDNVAELSGCSLYGGWIDLLRYNIRNPNYTMLTTLGGRFTCNTSEVSSNPKRVCMCVNSWPVCNITHEEFEHIPGQSFVMSAVAVGQRYGTVPSTVQAQFMSSGISPVLTGELDTTQYVQAVDKKCTQLTFTLRSSSNQERMTLIIANDNVERSSEIYVPGYELLFHQLELTFHLKTCPYGFQFNIKLKQCECQTVLLENKVKCDLQTLKVLRSGSKWINATLMHLKHDQESGVIVHDHCPFDYCVYVEPDDIQPIDLLNPDEQCTFNRSGVLCGACQTNFSHVLGTSKCKQCTKPWVFLIIPIIAIAGVALVVGLMVLNLTVSVGTINGLIFYTNIVGANQAVFFPYQASSSFLSIFIAWANLDLGIETCFYNGLDAYAKAWFQFLFPLYIWFMVIAIIVASHYSTRASRISGNNAVQVLATLFLLSYAKLLRIIITTFSSTQIDYPNGYRTRVWLYDGNVEYLQGKHIPLFIASLSLLVAISFPYTVSLFFIQWLQKLSHYKLLFWVAKLHPLFDAYTGPYKSKHRYWTGLLLLLRVCLFLIFSLNTTGDPTINLLATVIAMLCLFAYLSMVGGVYKHCCLNLIEITFILNLGILSAASLYQINRLVLSGVTITSISYISSSIAFALFMAIVFHHMIIKIIRSRKGKVLLSLAKDKICALTCIKRGNKDSAGTINPIVELNSGPRVTYSVVDLKEHLL